MTLAFEIQGPADAPAVLLSAGLGGTGAYWRPQMEALAAQFRVVTFDQRGTGRNRQDLPEPYSIEAMADDVVEVLDAAGIPACRFVGHALGAAVGLMLALRHPTRIKRLVPVNGWARLDSHTARCFDVRTEILLHSGIAGYAKAQPIFLYPAAWLSANAARVAAEEAHGVAHFQGADTLRRRIAALRVFDVADRLGEIATPTLVMANRDDMLVPWTASQAMAEAIPNAKLALFDYGGHAGNVVNPGPFSEALLAFLAG
jgi:aminoacrylate hydrolase